MTPSTLVSVQGLSRYYGALCAVDNLDFQIQRGEVLGFLGPNGAGKSTTMQMITGNLAPSTGRILINGVDLLDEPKRAKAEMGYLPEQPPLYRELTVDEYLRFCARLNRIPRHKVTSAMANAKQRCGLQQVGRRLIGNLSKGYQQRVGIAQAIIHSPAVVVLDEPTVGLDPIQIREIRQLIRELGGEHGVILSTHILPEVQAVCDRVQIINRGQLVLSDTLEGLAHQAQGDQLIAGFAQQAALPLLQSLPGVTHVEELDGGRWRLSYHAETNPAPALAEVAVNHGWGLLELTPQRRSLEEIFVEITSRDVGEKLSQNLSTPDAA